MLPKVSFNWQDAAKILLALVATGFAWTVDNQAGVISLVAMIVVWILGVLLKARGYKISKLHLTIAIFVFSVALTFLFQPVVLPAFPTWSGDVIMFVSAFMVWLGALVELGNQVIVWATGIYNILLAEVLEKLEYTPMIMRVKSAIPFKRLKPGVG